MGVMFTENADTLTVLSMPAVLGYAQGAAISGTGTD